MAKNSANRRKRRHLSAEKAGKPPGTLQYVGYNDPQPTLATLIEYGPAHDALRETRFTSLEQGRDFTPAHQVLWLNVHGLANVELLQLIGQRLRLHALTVEDLLNTQQRAKLEIYPEYLFITLRLHALDDEGRISSEQIAIVLGRRFVLTVQEQPTGTFASLREGLKHPASQLRKRGPDYLVYALLDQIIDRDFTVLAKLGDAADELEDVLLEHGAEPGQLTRIQTMRRNVSDMRRSLWPLREVLGTAQRDERDFFTDDAQLYLRDAYDHASQLIDALDSLRDSLAGQQDTYHSLQSHKLNLQMRRLTVITIVFMPLTLITGIFGMNFVQMPGLDAPYGFAATMAVMAAIALALAVLFRNKHWM
ncbi:magnesium/cobalt transporter CorA [Chitinibacteraceae bacterium HSL-7]